MSKWDLLKEAINNPPQERLCLINAGAFKLGIMGIIVAIIFLVQSDVWYLSFIFGFSVINNWVGYKREMRQHDSIINARKMMGVYQEIEEDPSFTRRRLRTIKKVIGSWVTYVVAGFYIYLAVFHYDLASVNILMKILYLFLVATLTLITTLFPVYWIAKMFGGNYENKRTNNK